ARSFPLDVDGQRRVVPRNGLRVGMAHRDLMDAVALRQDHPLFAIPDRIGDGVGPVLQGPGIRFAHALANLACQSGTLTQIELNVLARFEFLRQAAAPGLQVIHPAGDRVGVATERLHGEAPLPAVVAYGAHQYGMPLRRAVVTVEEGRSDGVMAVGEDVSLHGYAFADCALGRKPAAVHPRRDVFNDNPDFAHIVSLAESGLRPRPPASLRSEDHDPQRWQPQAQRVVVPMGGERGSFDAAEIADAPAAVIGLIAVESLEPAPGAWHANLVIVAGHLRKVARDQRNISGAAL